MVKTSLSRLALGTAAAVAACLAAPSAWALALTDAAIFSSNPMGQAYGGLIWNTVGNPPDTANRWNLYFSSSTDINSPVFLNDENDFRASIDIALTPGLHRFGVYADAAGDHRDHFTLSLYFNGHTALPDISAAAPVNGAPAAFVVATHADGLGLLEQVPLFVPNAGALSFVADGLRVTLREYFFETDTTGHPDLVWPHNQRHDFGPSPSGADFYGQIALNVVPVPEPTSLLPFAVGLAGLWAAARRRRDPATPTT